MNEEIKTRLGAALSRYKAQLRQDRDSAAEQARQRQLSADAFVVARDNYILPALQEIAASARASGFRAKTATKADEVLLTFEDDSERPARRGAPTLTFRNADGQITITRQGDMLAADTHPLEKVTLESVSREAIAFIEAIIEASAEKGYLSDIPKSRLK